MNPDRVIELIYALCFGLTGLSHLLHAQLWAEGLAAICRSRWAGFIIAGYTLPIALLGAFGHRWLPGPGLIVPIVGALLLLKCTIYALAPHAPAKWARKGFLTAAKIRIAGVMCLIIAAACGFAAMPPMDQQ